MKTTLQLSNELPNQMPGRRSDASRRTAAATMLVIGSLALILTTGAGKPPSTSRDIPLCVTIESWGVLGTDEAGEYCNGQNGVTAVFTADQGRLSFDTGTRRKAYVDLGTGLSPGAHRIHFLASRDHQDPNVNDPESRDPNWHDLNLDQLSEGESIPIGLLFFLRAKKEGDWIAAFGDYPEATEVNHWPCVAASPAIVTRINADTWTVESDDAADHCLFWGYAYQARIAFPFKMTLRLK